MFKNKFYALSLLISLSSNMIFAEDCQPCETSTDCQLATCNEVESVKAKNYFCISSEIEKGATENWSIVTDAIRRSIENAKDQTAATIIPSIQELCDIARSLELNGRLSINIVTEQPALSDVMLISQDDLMNASAIKVTYSVETGCQECPAWNSIHNATRALINSMNEEAPAESDAENCINSIFATLADPNNGINGQITIEVKNQ